MKQVRWIIGYTLSALLAVALAGTFGIIRSAGFTMALLPEGLRQLSVSINAYNVPKLDQAWAYHS